MSPASTEPGGHRPGSEPAGGGDPARRAFGLAVVACLAGAGLVVYGSTRTWSLQVVERPGLSDLRTATTGAADAPWLIGLALVALAGAGALLATRGPVRRGLGVLLALIGAGTAVGAIAGRAGLDAGSAGAGATFWPVVCVAGAALIMAGGLAAARSGHRWPTMGARYERRPAASTEARPAAHSGPSPAAGLSRAETSEPVDNRAAWDALDRGDDPTDR